MLQLRLFQSHFNQGSLYNQFRTHTRIFLVIFDSKKSSSDFVVLLSTTFTNSLHQNRRIHYTHNLMRQIIVLWKKFMLCVVSHHGHGYYHPDISFECVATTNLLQSWKQIIQYLLRDTSQRNVENQSTCIN